MCLSSLCTAGPCHPVAASCQLQSRWFPSFVTSSLLLTHLKINVHHKLQAREFCPRTERKPAQIVSSVFLRAKKKRRTSPHRSRQKLQLVDTSSSACAAGVTCSTGGRRLGKC